MNAPRKLAGLRPQAYEHPSDTEALNMLSRAAGLDLLIAALNSWGFERMLQVRFEGSFLRVTPESFPDLDRLLTSTCDIIDLPLRPRLYIAPELEINAYTVGVQHPMVIINMGALERLTPEEVGFVLGHELGHIKSSHVLYFQMGEFLPLVLAVAGGAIGNLLSLGLQLALLRWKRTSELTADRAGLLACQNQEVAFRTLMKMAGLPSRYFDTANTGSFVMQARQFQALDADKATMMAKHLSTLGRSHPWTVMRARELLDWIESGGFHDVMVSPQKDQIRQPPGQKGYCIQCGSPLHVADRFCSVCGANAEQT